MDRRWQLSWLGLCALTTTGLTAWSQPCIAPAENLGTLGGSFANAIDATPDLQTIVGVSQMPGSSITRAFVYSAQRGMVQVPPLANESWTRSFASAISDDGRIVAGASYATGTGASFRPFVYSVATNTTTNLGLPLGGVTGIATASSSSGNVVFGINGNELGRQSSVCWRWDSTAGFTIISNVSTARPHMGLVRAVSGHAPLDQIVAVGDGWTAAGPLDLSSPVAVRWTQAGGVQALPLGAESSTAMGISADGTVVVGTMKDPTDPAWWVVYRWTSTSGVQILGTSSSAGPSSKIVDVTPDGSQVFFQGIPQRDLPSDTRLMAWSASNGVVDLGPSDTSLRPTRPESRLIAGVHPLGTSLVAALELGQVNRRGDADNDGLPDDWECNGIPYVDAGGTPRRFVLDVNGDGLTDATPNYKDLFVEVDTMNGLAMPDEVATKVQLAFLNAPLTNPSTVTGVNLHILRDQTTIAFVQTLTTPESSCWPNDFGTYRAAHFGTVSEHGNAPLLAAKAKAFRYCFVANASGPKKWGGCGELPGDNTVLYAGGMGPDDYAAVLMHELGHNLGLSHGGDDGNNGKPNYPSIMNYAFSYRQTWNQAFWRMDFSRAGRVGESPLDFSLQSISEQAINELAPVGTPTNYYANFFLPVMVNELVNGQTTRGIRYFRLDGSSADVGDLSGTGFPDGSFDVVSQDLNYNPAGTAGIPNTPSPGQIFMPHDDWAKVSVMLAPRATLGAFAAAPQFSHDEVTQDDRAWIEANFPIPPSTAACDPIDFNNDGSLFDPTDIDALFSVFSEGPCVPPTSTCNDIDFNNDGSLFDPCDIDSFLLVFSEGPCTLCGQ